MPTFSWPKRRHAVEEARDHYARGVEAGELALGPQAFKEYAGHFWGFLETRPYMRARAGLAGALLKLGDVDGAIDHFRDMLRLNPNDNQGIRYLCSAACSDGAMKARSRSCWPHMRTMQAYSGSTPVH